MPPIAYTVLAACPDQATASEYCQWLCQGHIAAVLAAGALTGEVVRIDAPPHQVEARYTFASREAYDRYIRGSAPALRAQGLSRFPADRGIKFERRVGEVLQLARSDQ